MKKVFNCFLIFTLLFLSFSCASTNITADIDNDDYYEEDGEQPFLRATKKGIVITIPEEARGKATSAYIYRYTKDENGNLINEMWIYSHELKNLKTVSITDYFVEKGKEYYYRASFEGKDFTTVQIPLTPIIANDGIGELVSPENIKGTFDEKTCVMTFSPKLTFTKNIYDFTKTNPSFKAEMYIAYSCPYLNKIGEYNLLTPEIINGKANMLKAPNINIEKIYGQEFNFLRFATEVMDLNKSVTYKIILTDIDVPKTITPLP